jgi:hypothetical protein
MRLDVNSSGTGITDAASNGLNGGFTTGQTYTFQHTAPTVVSSNRVGASPTNATSVQFTVTFSEAVTGVSTGAFTLTNTGTVAGTIASVSGSGTTYTVTVNTITGDGTMRLDVNSSGTGITDAASNGLNGGFTTGQTYTFQHTAPTVLSSNRVGSSPTNATSVQFTVTFSEAVSGVSTSAFTLTNTGTVAGTIASVSGSGTTYTVTVNSVTGDGTMRLDVKSSGTGITDAASNGLNGGFTTGQTYTFQHTAPTVVSSNIAGTSPTNATSVQFTVTFSEAVSGVSTSAFTLTNTGTVAGTIASVSGSGTTYTVTVNTITGDGTMRLDVKSSGTGITDAASNGLNGGFTTGQTYTFVHSSPVVSSVTLPPNSIYTLGQNMNFTVNYSTAITVNTGGGTPYINLTLTIGGTVRATYVSGSGTTALVFTYVVASNNFSPNGITLGSSIVANGATLQDNVTNSANLSLNGVGPTSAILVDATLPTFANSSPQAIAVCQNSTNNSVNTVLTASDIDVGQTETWTVTANPGHGTLSGFASATAASGSTSIIPSGLSYTPTNGYSGPDAFTIKVSDGVANATMIVNVTVNPLPTITTGTMPSICSGVSSTSIPYSATTSSPNQYSIAWSNAAAYSGFANVALGSLPASPISITAPTTAYAGAYTGTLSVKNSSTGCIGVAPITVTLVGNPDISAMGITPVVYQGADSIYVSYNATGFSPTTYSIAYNAAAHTAGFNDATNVTLSNNRIKLLLPGGSVTGTYSGTITVSNGGTCPSNSYPINVTILNTPTITMNYLVMVTQGTTTSSLSYTSTTNSPGTYSIKYDAGALSAGFSDVSSASLPANSIPLAIPANAPVGTYTGSIRVYTGTAGSKLYPVIIRVY